MPRILLLSMLCLALAGCNAERRSGADLTQDSGQCSKFSWGTPEMAQCLDSIAAARAAASKPVETAQPAEPSPPHPALPAPATPAVTPAPAPIARTATARGRTAQPAVQAPALAAETPTAQPPETETPPKSWWSWPWGGTKSETEN